VPRPLPQQPSPSVRAGASLVTFTKMTLLDSSNELSGGLTSKQAIYQLYRDVQNYLNEIEVKPFVL